MNVARVVVELDIIRVNHMRARGIPVLFGDGSNPEILSEAGVERARALAVTVPDDATAVAIVAAARLRAPAIHIITRASTPEGSRRLEDAGATDIVQPELEGAIEIVRRTLLGLQCPVQRGRAANGGHAEVVCRVRAAAPAVIRNLL